MTVVVLTEKPSVARDIAAELGAHARAEGYLHGAGYQVTWAYGHLVGLAEPHLMNPAWKLWRAESLPMLPDQWQLEVLPESRRQFEIVSALLTDSGCQSIICATDAGREGELIFWQIYEMAHCRKPVQRLWISSLTPESIRAGFAALRPASEFLGLADSARARSRADWLVGMNLSRSYSIRTGQAFSVGRVQTPTLAMIVKRDLEIASFVAEDYLVLKAKLQQGGGPAYETNLLEDACFDLQGLALKKQRKIRHFKLNDPELQEISQRIESGKLRVHELTDKQVKVQPPQFYDLTELQRHANRLFGFSADKTLKLAQSLYEERKLITYPRTDSRYVGEDLAPKLREIAEALRANYRELDLLGERVFHSPLGKRFVDASRVSDHHAIVPTGKRPGANSLPLEEAKIFDLINRRLLMAFLPDHVYATTELIVRSEALYKDELISDYLQARGKQLLHLGWMVLEVKSGKSPGADRDLPADLKLGEVQDLISLETVKRRTSPPPRLNDASLLTAMETAGSTLDDKALSEAMREKGLGTPATRAAIIENLIKRQYVEREKQNLRATNKGIQLIAIVHDEVKSPALTGEWEQRLNQIRQGKTTLREFMDKIVEFVQATTSAALKSTVPIDLTRKEFNQAQPTKLPDDIVDSPKAKTFSSSELPGLLKDRFGFDRFRPHQEAICRDVVKGRDTLLVMPTGAGKSLCYQLPGLALGGRTLVISPLIALMDDQVSKLREFGLSAAAIHSGKSRQESQQICRQYAAGQVEFLLIAPERLAVPGFVPFLTKYRPTLIAIDEAHCISNWGHDFRYDYRRLKERLEPLRPVPIIAMTATATSRVQDDIIAQLGVEQAVRHIRGFRRTNIAIEAVEITKAKRSSAVARVLGTSGRLPAIVYAPTRKEAEQAAEFLASRFRVAAYHAGMNPELRSQIQDKFINGSLDLIVATTAFGMGVDKSNVRTVIHLAVPGSLESYYQEIGRAGRDGKLSRAILLYSFADMKTHEYFHRLNYPEAKVLQQVCRQIKKSGTDRNRIKLAMPAEELQAHLERLVMIGAIRSEGGDAYVLEAKSNWVSDYEEQKQYRYQQLMEMNRFVQQQAECRMLRLMAHFGDEDANGEKCGICDVCAPETSLLKQVASLSQDEISLGQKIADRLTKELRPVAMGTIFRDIAEPLGWQRRDFERLLDGLIQQGYLKVDHSTFNKSGEIIRFRTVELANSKPDIPWQSLQIAAESQLKASARPRKRAGASRGSPKLEADLDQIDHALLERLRAWRKKEASAKRIPAFRILSDRSLEMIASIKPETQNELLDIHGIGQVKVDRFGTSILNILQT